MAQKPAAMPLDEITKFKRRMASNSEWPKSSLIAFDDNFRQPIQTPVRVTPHSHSFHDEVIPPVKAQRASHKRVAAKKTIESSVDRKTLPDKPASEEHTHPTYTEKDHGKH